MATPPLLSVTVVSPEGVLHQGKFASVTAINEVGSFDVLPGHANFISIIKDSAVLRESNKAKKDIPLKNGILCCQNNEVTVYIGLIK